MYHVVLFTKSKFILVRDSKSPAMSMSYDTDGLGRYDIAFRNLMSWVSEPLI